MKKYLSLYKTSSEHSSDNSRLIPNISLITDEQRLILTNENNIDTTFTEVDIIESFDDIINRFPTGNSTGMPGIKIYGDNTDQSKTKNIKIYNDAKQWRSNYISNNGLGDTGQWIRINVDALMIDNITVDGYDSDYNYCIYIYNDRIMLFNMNDYEILTILNNGIVKNYLNRFSSLNGTEMPGLKIYTDNTKESKANNIELYNNAQEWREIGGTNNIGHLIIDALIIDDTILDKYDNNYKYSIDIYPDSIMLGIMFGEKILTIFSDGSVSLGTTITTTLL